MLKYIAPGLFSLALLSAPALAAPPQEKGFFIGGAFGAAELDDDGAFGWRRFDDSDNALTVFAGYKFLRYFAVEARYANLGSYSVTYSPWVDRFDVSAVSAHAVGLVPFGNSGWELYGQIGLGSVDIDCAGCEGGTAGSAGLGLRFSPTSKLAIGIQVDAYVWEEDYYHDFAVATTQVVLQYLF